MILEDVTFERFGYYPSDLKLRSAKPILAACNECGKVRVASKHDYHELCGSCAKKGNKHPMYSKHHSDEARKKQSENHPDCKEDKNSNYKDGLSVTDRKKYMQLYREKNKKNIKKYASVYKKTIKGKNTDRKRQAKRRRQLGYTLILPLEEGEVGHHVTNEYVIGIPKDAHQRLCGNGRQKHRMKVLTWLKENDTMKYNLVLFILAEEPL